MKLFQHKSIRMMAGMLLLGALLTLGGCSSFCKPTHCPKKQEPAPQTNLVPTDAPKAHDELTPTGLFPAGTVETVYFDYDKSALRKDQMAQMDKNLKYLLDHATDKVLIEGHCDERGSVEYNFSLGQRRADSVKTYFIKNGLTAARVNTVSKGKECPAVQGKGEQSWAKNRRAEFKREQ